MIDATQAPSWGYPAPVCPSHWLWAIEHWKAASQHPVGAMDETGTWGLW